MFLFVDGKPVILTFTEVENLFYRAFVDEFPEAQVSISQWKGSYEYQALYPAMQLMLENGAITNDSINKALKALEESNQKLKRPAVLHSRVSERFSEIGYEANIRPADINNKGIVAIAVDYERTIVQTDRILGVGNDGLDYGLSPAVGSLDNKIFDGLEINNLLVTSDYSLPVRISNTVSLQFPNHMSNLDIDIEGFGSVSLIWNGTNSKYETTNESLTDFVVINNGANLTFRFPSEDVIDDPTVINDTIIGNLIRDEMLPAGQHIEGDIEYFTSISNGQPITIRWRQASSSTVNFRITALRSRNSQYPVDDVATIIEKFTNNFNTIMRIGSDIAPAIYLTLADIPWASQVLVEYDEADGTNWKTDIYESQFFEKWLSNIDNVNVIIN